MSHIQRNDPCFCGSGKKYKWCCLNKTERQQGNPWNPLTWIGELYIFILHSLEAYYDAAEQNRRPDSWRGFWPIEWHAAVMTLACFVLLTVALCVIAAKVYLLFVK